MITNIIFRDIRNNLVTILIFSFLFIIACEIPFVISPIESGEPFSAYMPINMLMLFLLFANSYDNELFIVS